MASGLQRLSSGDMLAALEGLGGGEASDFDLTKDEVTIAQIHNLSTGRQSRAMSDFGSSLLGGTDLSASLPADHSWQSPAVSGGDSFAPRVPSSTSLATSDRGSRGSVGRTSGVAARGDPALADSASSKPRASAVPRVASLAKPAPKRDPPPASPGAAKPSATRARLDSLSSASSRTLSPRGSMAAPGTSSRPSVGPRSPTPRSSTVSSPASSGAPSPVPRTSSISGRIPSSPNTGRPTSPPGPAPVYSRGASSPNLGPRLSVSAADGGVAPRASSVTAARSSLSPSGPSALGSRIPRPSVSAQASPDSRPSLAIPAGATSPGAAGRASLGPTSPGRPSLLKGPSGKYVGAAGKAPARKALEDIMSELQEVKQQLGLPVTSRSSRAGSEVDDGLDEDDVLAATRAARLAASAAPGAAAAPVVAMGVPVGLPVEPASVAAGPSPEEASRIVLNISVSESAEAVAEGQQVGTQAEAAAAEQDPSAAAETAAQCKQEGATTGTSSEEETAAAAAAAAAEAQAVDAAAEHESRVAAAALVARAFAAAIVRSEQEELLAAREAERAQQEAERAKEEAEKQAAAEEVGVALQVSGVPADATADVTGVVSPAPAAKEEEPAAPAAAEEEEKEQPAPPAKVQPEPLDLTGKENKPVNTCGCGCVIM